MSTTMNASEFTPSASGSAESVGALSTVNSGSNPASTSGSVSRTNMLRANSACQGELGDHPHPHAVLGVGAGIAVEDVEVPSPVVVEHFRLEGFEALGLERAD